MSDIQGIYFCENYILNNNVLQSIVKINNLMLIRQIITERKMADLYHYTYADNLEGILKDKAIMPNNGWVSLTRDKRYQYTSADSEDSVRLVIDQGKLANTIKLEPYDWNASSDEFDNNDWMREPGRRRVESEERTRRPVPLNCVKMVEFPTSWDPRAMLQYITHIKKHPEPGYADFFLPVTIRRVKKKMALLHKLKKMHVPFSFNLQ